MPIWHLDTWSHWKYGEWIWQHGRLPDREPFSPYSDKQTPLVDTWWLSQVLCYLIYSHAGMEGIALFYGLVQLVKTALYLSAFWRVSGSLLLAVIGTALVQLGMWEFAANFRPQMIGEVCWAGLLAVLAGQFADDAEPLGVRGLLGIALCVGLWANLHGAFLLAYVVLSMLLAGRYLEQAWAIRNPIAALRQPDVIRLAVGFVVAVASSCVNPYGVKLLTTALNFGKMPVLQNVQEWQPRLPLQTYGSVVYVLSVLLVFGTVRLSPRRFRPAEIVLLLFFGLSAWFTARMLPWWMTLCPFLLLPHWAAFLKDRVPGLLDDKTVPSRWPVAVGGAIALGLFLASGTGQWLLRREPRPLDQQVSPMTPVEESSQIKRWLARSEPETSMGVRLFATSQWSDYLLRDLPPSARVYYYTHWNAYAPRRMQDAEALLQLSRPPRDWHAVVDRYRLNMLALRGDSRSSRLIEYLTAEEQNPRAEWQIMHKGRPLDGIPSGLVAVRRVDPFVVSLAEAQAAQACVGGTGLAPMASQWAWLTHLPWFWNGAEEARADEARHFVNPNSEGGAP
jgi:hypothetical protein